MADTARTPIHAVPSEDSVLPEGSAAAGGSEPQGETLNISLDDIDLDGLELIEDASGKTIAQLFPDGRPSARGLRALYWYAKSRQDPSFTWEQAGKVKLEEFSRANTPSG